jgi:arylformamidase
MSICEDMKVYKNRKEKIPELVFTKTHINDGMCESKIILGMHTGTHLDAPYHILESGITVDKLNIENLITKCKVIDFTNLVDSISKKELLNKGIKKDDFLLFKTTNSKNIKFNPDFIYLDKSGAKYLVDLGIKGVGTDGLGIERSQKNHETHKLLLGNGIYILEGLNLEQVKSGEYQLIALPLKIKGAEASPVRAVLIE